MAKKRRAIVNATTRSRRQQYRAPKYLSQREILIIPPFKYPELTPLRPHLQVGELCHAAPKYWFAPAVRAQWPGTPLRHRHCKLAGLHQEDNLSS